MANKLIIAVLLMFSARAYASGDSIFVSVNKDDNGWVIHHTVRKGETVFSISRRFHVPPAVLSDVNGFSYQTSLSPRTIVNVPVGAYNEVKDKPDNMGDARPLYFRVANGMSLRTISHYADVPQRVVQRWNDMPDNNIEDGQLLFVGWVLYDATNTTDPNTVYTPPPAATPPAMLPRQPNAGYQYDGPQRHADKGVQTELIPMQAPDTMKDKTPEEQNYMAQTNNDLNTVTEKGPAVFFESAHHGATYYAFHNGTPRDQVIKVHNPGNNKTIFVKVIGPVPEIKLYDKTIIGISNEAKAALGVREGNKAWVELSFAP